MTDNDQNKTTSSSGRPISEELEVMGSQLVERVKELIDQGNIRRLIIRDQNGRTLLEIPLTIGVVAGGALAFLWPVMAGLAIIGGMLARVKIEVVREAGDEIEAGKHKNEDSDV